MARMRDSEAWIEHRGQSSTDFPDGTEPPGLSNSRAQSDSVGRVGSHVPQPEGERRQSGGVDHERRASEV